MGIFAIWNKRKRGRGEEDRNRKKIEECEEIKGRWMDRKRWKNERQKSNKRNDSNSPKRKISGTRVVI